MPSMNPAHSQLWGIHLGLCYAFNKEKFIIHLETDDLEAYNVVDEMNLEDAFNHDFIQALHQIFMCSPEKEQPENADCEIFPISPEANHFTKYLANFDLIKCAGLSNITEDFGKVRELGHMDISMGVPLHALEITPNFGMGEVIDGDKGKGKLIGDVAFNNNGILSKKAIEVLGGSCNGRNMKRKACFGLDKYIAKGITTSKWLEDATKLKMVEKKNLWARKVMEVNLQTGWML
ncbi:hypothetical protein POM88_043985 [Heracleum sosnowskyi]|uniref:Uncharacterized protein n=1 Tax=Heracleum sosnowskyi TaxID=360622 RepID=A0AAD8H2Y4_9APIA|nr:hypothetical protein POM88_043985 [Heracleum sosnowskyi]